MKPSFKILTIILLSILFNLSVLNGQDKPVKQDKKVNYGKAPDEIFPYDKFVKPYKYHTSSI